MKMKDELSKELHPHECNPRCVGAVHYDIVLEANERVLEVDVLNVAPSYMKIHSIKRVEEFPILKNVVGAWGIYFEWEDHR